MSVTSVCGVYELDENALSNKVPIEGGGGVPKQA